MWLVLAFSAMFIWGLSDVLYKSSTTDKSRFTIYAADSIIYGLFGFLFSGLQLGFMVDWKLFLTIYPLGLFHIVSTAFYIRAMNHTYASIASPIMSSNSIITIPLGIFILGEKLSVLKLFLVFIATICIAILALPKKIEKESKENKSHIKGVVFSLLYLFTTSAMYFSAKLYVGICDSKTLVYYYSISSAMSMCVFLFFSGKWRNLSPSSVPNKLHAIAAIGTHMGGYILYVTALTKNDISKIQPIVFSYSIVTPILSRILLKETLTIRQNVIIIMIIICITLLSL